MQRGESGEDLCAQASLAYLQEQTNPTQALDLYQEVPGWLRTQQEIAENEREGTQTIAERLRANAEFVESRIRALNSRLGKWPGNSNAVTNVALENERIRVPVINRNVDVVTPSLQQQKYKCGMVIMIVTISLEVVYSCYLNMQVFESGFTLKNTCSLVYNVLASTGFPLQIGLLFVPLIFLYPRRPLTWLFYILSIGCQIFIYIFHKLFASEDTQEVFSDFHAFFCGFCFFLGLFFFMFWAAHPPV